jgi:hypothetical protein
VEGRISRATSCPSFCIAGNNALPTSPVDPEMRNFTLSFSPIHLNIMA